MLYVSHKKDVPSVMRQNKDQRQDQHALELVSRSALGTELCPGFSPDCMLYSRHFRFYLHFGYPLRGDDVLIGEKHAARVSGPDLCFLKERP
jgi:hypothetical protein